LALAQSGGPTPEAARETLPATAARLSLSPDVAAVVDGQAITRAEWQQIAALDRALSQIAGQPPPDAEATLDRLINERLVLMQAGSGAFAIGSSEAEERLAALTRQWGVDDVAFNQALSSSGLTRDDVLDAVQRLMTVEAVLNDIAATQDSNAWMSALRRQAHIEVHADLAAIAPAPAAPPAAPTPAPAVLIGIQVGQQSPDFTLSDLDGAPLRLSDWRGRAVVLNFWATWCPPCRVEAPALQSAFERYQERDVTVLGIDQREDAATVRSFASELGLTYPLLLDSDGSASALYQVVGIPTTLFLDASGVVAARHVGPLTEEQIAQYVDRLLGADAPPTASSSDGTATDFSLPRETGESVRLSDYRGKSSVVLVFYRGST
jgi:peroxiredoxin